MKNTAFIFNRPNGPKNDYIPSMVILITKDKILATGDKSTFAAIEAESITNRYRNVAESEIPNILDEFKEAFAATTFSYGGNVEMIDYSGDGKKKVDTIMQDLLTSANDAMLNR